MHTASYDLPGRVTSLRSYDRDAGRVVVQAGGVLLLLDEDLHALGEWPLPDGVVGVADVCPVSDRVVFDDGHTITLREHGEDVWQLDHAGWGGDFQSGGAFLRGDHVFAVVPDPDHEHLDLLRLAVDDGVVTGTVQLDAAPSGIELVGFPDGRVAIALGEGEDGARAWFLDPDADELQAVEAPWDDRILTDVHASGRWVLTTPHRVAGPLQVLSWPELELVWEVTPPGPPGSCWLESAVFVGDDLVAAFVPMTEQGEEAGGEVLRIPPNQPITRVGGEEWPASGGVTWWLEYDGARLVRRA